MNPLLVKDRLLYKLFKKRSRLPSWRREMWDYYVVAELEQWEHKVEQVIAEQVQAVHKHEKNWKQVGLEWLDRSIHMPRFKVPSIRMPRVRLPRPSLGKWIALFKGWTHQTARVVVASSMIFVIGFFALNASAYAEIIQTSIQHWRGIPDDTTMEEQFVTEKPIEQELLAFTNNPDEQKQQMADLDLSVTPPDNRLIIPKLDKNIPIIESDPAKLLSSDWETLEKTFQEDLKSGVLHYPGTSVPGEPGNMFITGHSSYYFWDSGNYKNVFARLNHLEVGDDIVIYYDQQKYHYQVTEKKEVSKDDVSVLAQGDDQRLTLMTCTPVGTNLRRLIVTAELVD